MKLKQDLYSFFNPGHKYASAGDEVELIRDSGNVLLVRGPNNDCFPAPISAFSDQPSEQIIKPEKPSIATRTIKKVKSVPFQPQHALF